MARILGGIATSHVPAIGNAIARKLYQDPYWKPMFDGYPPVHRWLAKVKPDVAVMIFNDHGLNFFLSNIPTFAVGAAFEYRNEDEGWGLKPVAPIPGDPQLSWHIIESLVADEFDIASCQEMRIDHAVSVPMGLLWPDRSSSRGEVRIVPVGINTVQHPLPTPARCYRLGQAIGRAIESYPKDIGVVVIGTGGLSHQLDGQRAGFINKEFDLKCLDKIVGEPEALTGYSIPDIVRLAGAQGAEIIMWLAMRGAMTGRVSKLHSNYHIPISNTGAGLLLLENAA
jgi:protocatechuate 4,5-dioxygenase beta chain